jgi:anti-anti-sigma factor
VLEETIKFSSSPIADKPGCFLINLEGDLDSSNAQEVIKYVQNMLTNDGLKHLIADFENLRYINSTGLGAILKISKMLISKEGSFKIANPNESVYEIIEIVGASKLLVIYKTMEDAIASLNN